MTCTRIEGVFNDVHYLMVHHLPNGHALSRTASWRRTMAQARSVFSSAITFRIPAKQHLRRVVLHKYSDYTVIYSTPLNIAPLHH